MTSRPKKSAPPKKSAKRPMPPTDRIAWSPIVERPLFCTGAQIADWFVDVGPKVP